MTSRDHFSPIGYGTPMTDIVERLEARYHETAEPECDLIQEAAAEIERLTRRLYEVDAQLTAEDHIHAKECMALRAEKDAEIERLQAEVARLEYVLSISAPVAVKP